MIIDIEEITNILTSKKIKIIGSYNPEKLHLSENNFYDGSHLKQETIDKIFKFLNCK